MNNIKSISYHPSGRPFTGREILQRLRCALARERGYRMTLQRLGIILGKSTSTAGYWFNVFESPQVAAIFTLLERLSEEGRQRFMRSICRTLPTVLHSGLSHSPKLVADLLETLTRQRGITVFLGGNETSRSYLITALGHTFPQMNPHWHAAAGIDLYPCEHFVPVESLFLIRRETNRDRLRAAIQTAWSEIEKSSSPVVLLHGMWSNAPELHEDILRLSRTRHIIIAEARGPELVLLAKKGVAQLQAFAISHTERPFQIQAVRQMWKPRGRPRK